MTDTDHMTKAIKTHEVWHRFSNWIVKTYGKDLHGEWQYLGDGDNKLKYRSFDELELSRRLVGYDVMTRVSRYVKRYCPEIKIISCDDSVYAGSDILLIPHPKHGITIMFIPQCTNVQNQFFLYREHWRQLMKELDNMSWVYSEEFYEL